MHTQQQYTYNNTRGVIFQLHSNSEQIKESEHNNDNTTKKKKRKRRQMSYSIDLATHGKEMKQAYDAVISSDPSVNWAVFNYDAGQNSSLRLAIQGGGPLSDFVEEFDDGKVQYGFAKVDYNNIPKYVLVGWVGEGVPERTKGYFNAHYATVAKYFRGYHVQITARSSEDLSESVILQKVYDASGSKYSTPAGSGTVPLRPKSKPAGYSTSSVPDEDWGDDGATGNAGFAKVPSSYKPTKVEVGTTSTSSRPEQVKPSYEPVGKVDIAAIRAAGKDSKFADDRPTAVKPSYQPVGKVDIAAIRAEAKANPNYKSTFESQPIKASEPAPPTKETKPKPAPAPAPAPAPTAGDDDDGQDTSNLSVKDRMRAFGNKAANSYTPPPPTSSFNKPQPPPQSKPQPPQQQQVGGDDDEQHKSVYTSSIGDSGRLSSLPKPKVQNTVSDRYGATRGTAPALPKDPFSSQKPKASTGFKDFASENGKSPAQLWAEKHGKAPAPSSGGVSQPVNREPSPEPEIEQEDEEEKPDISSLRNQFSQASVQDNTPPQLPTRHAEEEEEDNTASSSFSDITSRFAQQNQSDPTPPPLPPAANRPVPPPPAPEPEHEQPVPEPETHFELANPVPRKTEPEPEPEQHVVPEGQGAIATALYDYEKDEDNEIELNEGELVTDIDFVDSEWWAGKNQKGEYGLFPAAYVELQDGAIETAPADNDSEQPAGTGPSAVAEYDYEAAEEGELTFPEGAIITDIDFVDENWWSGVYNGERNLFPANYVTLQN